MNAEAIADELDDIRTAVSGLDADHETAALLVAEAIEYLEELAELTGKGKRLMAVIGRLEEARELLENASTDDINTAVEGIERAQASTQEPCHANP